MSPSPPIRSLYFITKIAIRQIATATWGVVGDVAGGVNRDCVGVVEEERPEVVESLLLHPLPIKPIALFAKVASPAGPIFVSVGKLSFRRSLNADIDNKFGLCC